MLDFNNVYRDHRKVNTAMVGVYDSQSIINNLNSNRLTIIAVEYPSMLSRLNPSTPKEINFF